MPRFDPIEFSSHEDLKNYYGGFFPTQAWAESLATVPRDQRSNPHDLHEVKKSNKKWIASLQKQARAYMAFAPEELLGLVPRRNRIAGNARKNNDAAQCPCGDGARLTWTPEDPDRIWCPKGHTVDPFELFPQTGTIEIVGPKGDRQEYPYHDAPDGKRIYLYGEYIDSVRLGCLSRAADVLAMLYRATEDVAYAERASAIVYDFACAVPHWPKIHRGLTSVASEEDRFRPVEEQVTHAGIWRDRNHAGLNGIAGIVAYNLVVNAPVWEPLDRLAESGDARQTIEKDLFLYLARDAIRADIHFPQPNFALRNHIPSQCEGMIAIGKAAGVPELVHYAYWKLRQMAEKTIMADSTFPESMSYAAMHLYGMVDAAAEGEGYSDPPGFLSSLDGARFDNLYLPRQLPELYRAVDVLKSMVYPDGNYIQAHDTTYWFGGGREPIPETVQPIIYPAFGHTVLGRGERERKDQIQAHLHYSGNWGHDHHDMLNLILWAYGEELVSDFGKIMTYRLFADGSWGHNLVVVDRKNQERVYRSGCLLNWHAPANEVQVVEASEPAVYPQCGVYRRALFLIPGGVFTHISPRCRPLGETDNLVLDIFEVEGGNTHEWMAQGNCINGQTLEVSVPTEYDADSYADDGVPFTPPAHREWEKQLQAQGLTSQDVSPWYGVFRDVHKGKIQAPFTAVFRSVNRNLPDLRLHLLEPTDADLYTCTVPGLKQGRNAKKSENWDHSLVEKYRMPKLVVRRDGVRLHSRFVALWEPTRGTDLTARVENLAPGHPDFVALEIHTAGQGETIRTFYSADPSQPRRVDKTEFQGRYAVVRSCEESKYITLYDTACFRDGDLELTISDRSPLLLEKVTEQDGESVLILNGIWEDIPRGNPLIFPEPELVVLSQDGGYQRAFPVKSAETGEGQTLLRCSRHPGFEYDLEARILKEISFPFHTVEGKAEVRLPSRVWARSHAARPGVWEIRTTNGVTISARHMEPTASWVTISL